MAEHVAPAGTGVSETGSRVNAVREWRSALTCFTGAALLFLTVTGLSIYLLPFSVFNQFGVLVHTIAGIATLAPIVWYVIRHWLVRRRGKLSHFQLLGYISVVLLLACMISGIVVTWQGATGPRIGSVWDLTHLVTGITVVIFVVVHLATVVIRKVNNPESRRKLVTARHGFYRRSVGWCAVLLGAIGIGAASYPAFDVRRPFPEDYNWSFGDDRPFAPSLARVDYSPWSDGGETLRQHGAVDARAMAGSAGCGTSGCHNEIYREWLPSAHRYSSMDDMFQRVQTFMAEETSPEHTRYCAGCHMPLAESDDPARGDETDHNRAPDDARHRSHRMLASNQYVPLIHELEGAEEHVRLTEQWLRGEIEIPEIADRWTTGPVVRMSISAPERVAPGERVPVQVILTNNKTGHDFPTGPLDMIESWIELTVTDGDGTVLHHEGGLDEHGAVADSSVWFKADEFDRKGETIDRHNLWDMVGASYKRTLFPGVTDTMRVEFQCPSMARGRVSEGSERVAPGQRLEAFDVPAPSVSAGGLIHVTAVLWYRKANPEFLDRVYGADAAVRSPVTEISRVTASIEVVMDGQAAAQ